MEFGPVIESTGALIYCTLTSRYLFLLRNGNRYQSTWGLPGGKLEAGELVSAGLAREIQEELGGVIADSKLIPIETFTSDNGNFVYHTFLIPVEQEFVPFLNHEHRGYAWVQLDDYPRPLHPGVWRTIKFDTVAEKIRTAVAAFKA
jgi:8-oxo-dGTP pyrophosphatase MutT (NUDIX family)